MKFKTPNSSTIQDAVVSGLGVTAGGMLSKGVNTFLPQEAEKRNTRIGIKAGITAVALAAMASISSKDTVSNGLKSAFVGVAGESIINLTGELLKDSSIAQDARGNKTKLFAQAALGLKGSCGCPLATSTQIPEFSMPAMNMPVHTSPIQMYQAPNGVFTAS